MAQQELESLRNLVLQAQQIVAGVELPKGHGKRLREVLDAAVALADDLIATPPAAVLGSRGGKATAKRGPEYFARIAAMRKTKSGGRPKKS